MRDPSTTPSAGRRSRRSTVRLRRPTSAGWAARIALAFIRVYKIALSPLFAGSCRYMPGCADYMTESITRFGFVRGGWLGTKRLCRCHPFGGHGYDPVPASPDQSIDQALAKSPAQ